MKVAFWSNYENSGVTSNATVISVMMSFLSNDRNIMISNHYNHKFLGHALLGDEYNDMLHEECNYFKNGDISHFIKQVSNRMNKELLGDCAVEIIDDGLYYVLQNPLFCNDIFDYNFNNSISEVFNKLDTLCDNIIIDTKSQQSLSTKIILDSADIVVVNLRQEAYVINSFFKRYSSILHKCIFVISSYHKDAAIMKRQIVQTYGINSENIAVIPDNMQFHDAMTNGSIFNFVSENMRCQKGSKNHYFMRHLKNATTMLMKRIYELKDGEILPELCEDVK